VSGKEPSFLFKPLSKLRSRWKRSSKWTRAAIWTLLFILCCPALLHLFLILLLGYEVRIGENRALRWAIDISVIPHVTGASLSAESPSGLCRRKGDDLIVSADNLDAGSNTSPIACYVSEVVLPGEHCEFLWQFRDCLVVKTRKHIFELPRIRSAIESAIANPCASFPTEFEKPRYQYRVYSSLREQFHCNESEVGNRYDVFLVITSGDHVDEVLKYPASRW